MLTPNNLQGQITDTIYINESAFQERVIYNAQDSFYIDLKQKQVHLYNNAKVIASGIELEAGYIMIDLKKREVYATSILDVDSNRIQKPIFKDGADIIETGAIRYNFDTKKGYIEEVTIEQDENLLYMDVAKKQDNNEIHFLRGRFTTCDLDEPHYHFQLSKAILIPEKRIVSGPMNLWVMGVPTPLGLPFSVIPQMEEKSKGLVFPQIVPVSSYGFGVQDLGYYLPVNDRFQTTFYGTIYSRGAWGLKNVSQYAKRYKHTGNFTLGYQSLTSGFPNNLRRNRTTVIWQHRMDQKANPFWNFSAAINFISDNNPQTSLDPLNPQHFNNTLRSDINLLRKFPGLPISAGMKMSLRQSSINNTITVTSPIVNFNATRFYPLKKLFKVETKANRIISRIGVTYNFEGQNAVTFNDSLLKPDYMSNIGSKYHNGIYQDINIQTTGSLFRSTWNITPSVRYTSRMNFQQTRKSYDAVNNNSISDTIQEFGMHHNLNFGVNLTTGLYSYYKYAGKNKTVLRHVLTPSFGFTYTPSLNSLIEDSVGVDKALVSYSPFENSIYRAPSSNEQAILRFGFNNTFELKHRSKKDSVTGYKKTRIIDALSFSGYYDFLREEKKLSNIQVNLRVSPIPWLNFVGSSSFSPYSWIDSTGAETADFAIHDRNILGRFTSNNLSTTLTFTSKKSREKLNSKVNNQHWDSDFTYFALHPELMVDYEIPWKLSLSHIYTLNINQSRSDLNPDKWNTIQTIMVNGDLSFTKRWKLAANVNVDIKTLAVTNARFSLNRDMHCWALAFHWTPIGVNKSFLFTIRSTSKLFKDAKINIRKPPEFL